MQHFLHAISCSTADDCRKGGGAENPRLFMADHVPIGRGTERDSARCLIQRPAEAAMMFSLLGVSVISGKSEYVSVY